MANIPDIIIRTAEEREADKESLLSFPYLLAEYLQGDFVGPDWYSFVRVGEIHNERDMPGQILNTWRFRDRESLHLFASMRIRELINEGVDACQDPQQGFDYKRCYDRRTQLEVATQDVEKLVW